MLGVVASGDEQRAGVIRHEGDNCDGNDLFLVLKRENVRGSLQLSLGFGFGCAASKK